MQIPSHCPRSDAHKWLITLKWRVGALTGSHGRWSTHAYNDQGKNLSSRCSSSKPLQPLPFKLRMCCQNYMPGYDTEPPSLQGELRMPKLCAQWTFWSVCDTHKKKIHPITAIYFVMIVFRALWSPSSYYGYSTMYLARQISIVNIFCCETPCTSNVLTFNGESLFLIDNGDLIVEHDAGKQIM